MDYVRITETSTVSVYVGRFPTDFTPTLRLMRVHLKMARETADDVVRARGRVITKHDDSALFNHEEIPFLDNLRHGIWRTWFENGRRDEWPCFFGRLHGVFRGWHANGTLSATCTFVNENEHGIIRYWHEDGSLDREDVFEHGRRVPPRNFPPPTTYKGRFPIEFAETLLLMLARLRMTRETVNDVVRARGYVVVRSLTVDLREEISYLDKLRHGHWRRWSSSGVRNEMVYVHGRWHGITREWYAGGTLSSVSSHVNSTAHGHVHRWRADGSHQVEEVYDYGRLVSRRRRLFVPPPNGFQQ